MGYKSLLIDMDPQGNATSGLGFDRKAYSPSIYETLLEFRPIKSIIKETSTPGHSLAGAGSNLIGAEHELSSVIGKESRLRGALGGIKSDFEFIFIDCPPSLGLLTINALNACDSVLVPMQSEYFALEGVALLMETIDHMRKAWNKKMAIEMVLTMHDPRIGLANQVRDEIANYFKDSLYSAAIPRNIRLAEAPSFGKSIIQYDAHSKGGQAYLALAQEFIAKRSKPDCPPREQGRSQEIATQASSETSAPIKQTVEGENA